MPQKAKLTANPEMLYFEDTRLCMVVTVSEVSYMWDKSKSTIMHHVYKGNLIARKTLTGGEWLILTASVLSMWKQPVNDNLYNYFETDKKHAQR